MKRVSLILSCFVLVSLVSNAQTFDLNTYKYRYQYFKGLTTNFEYNSRANQYFLTNDAINYFNNQTFSNLDFQLNPTYFTQVNTDELQKNTSFTLSEEMDYSRSRYDDIQPQKIGFNSIQNIFSISSNSTRRKYNGQKFNYLSYNLYASYGTLNTQSKENKEVVNGAKNTRPAANLSLQIGKGNGRLEYVTDAVSAQFLANDLASKLGVVFTETQLYELSKGITTIKNQRYLDFRFKFIDQVAMLDSVLKTNDINAKNNLIYFTTLSDNWLYATRLNRYSGKRWTYMLDLYNQLSAEDKLSYNNSGNITDFELYQNNYFFSRDGFLASFDQSTQKSLTVQKERGFSVGAYYEQRRAADEYTFGQGSAPKGMQNPDIDIEPALSLKISGYWSYMYQPNTRNYFTFTLYPRVDIDKGISLTSDRFEITPALSSYLNYYKWISPQLNFRVGCNFSVRNSFGLADYQPNNVTQSSQSLNAGFAYQFY